MRLAQSGVRRGQDGRRDGPAAARGRCWRSARAGDVPANRSAGTWRWLSGRHLENRWMPSHARHATTAIRPARLRGHAHGVPVPLASMARTCPLGHQLGPGRVLLGWHPCGCPPAGRPVCGPRSPPQRTCFRPLCGQCHARRSPPCVTPPATRSCPRHGRRLRDRHADRPMPRTDTGTRGLVTVSQGGW